MSLVSEMITSTVHGPLPDDCNLIFLEGKSLSNYQIHLHLLFALDLLKCQCTENTWLISRLAISPQSNLENKRHHSMVYLRALSSSYLTGFNIDILLGDS